MDLDFQNNLALNLTRIAKILAEWLISKGIWFQFSFDNAAIGDKPNRKTDKNQYSH
jgi:hypothetical protein